MSAHTRRSLLTVVLVAFAVRAFALWCAADATPVLDERQYTLRAQALLDGAGYLGSYQTWVQHPVGRHAELPQYPGSWQPPGQTVFMAAVMGVSGGSELAVKLVQVLLAALSVGLVYALGCAWFDARSGLAAAWLAVFYPNLVAFSHYLWSETLFVFLLLAALWLLTQRRRPPGAVQAAAGGLVLGLAALTRGTILYFLPVFCAWLLWSQRRQWRAALRASALVALTALLVVAPWSVRNTRLHGGFVLIETNGPYNLWRGNGPDAFANHLDPAAPRYPAPFDGVPLSPVGNRTGRRLVEEAKQALATQTPTDLEIIRYAGTTVREEIRSNPGAFVARIPTRLADMWNPTSFLVRHYAIGAYGETSPVWAVAVSAAAVLAYLLVLLLGAVGFWRARGQPEAWLVLLLAGFLSAVSAVAFGLTRFRLPVMPLVIVLAGHALAASPARRRTAAAAVLLVLPAALLGCRPVPPPSAPNLLWVVWDTVRADRMSLYGHPHATTPRLDALAQRARVFDDALSPAGYTLPAHASMFTGLLPSEHCTHNEHPSLDDRYTTLAERLRDAGWRTFLYSANPQVSKSRNLNQGFEVSLHPWTPRYRDAALAEVRAKLSPQDRSSELPERLHRAEDDVSLLPWNIKASGSLAQRALLEWLDAGDSERPWFAFLNYMEAHRPTIPPREYRALLMSPEEVERSYSVDRSWLPMWEYTFGLRDYSPDELALTRATYDATLRELDDLFAELLAALERQGQLENTVVVLTSDHGEHLGEQHMLDHQYSVYQPLLRVPLVILAPGRVSAGRATEPVSTLDLYPTLLALAGLDADGAAGLDADGAAGLDANGTAGVDLLAPRAERVRLAESPAYARSGIREVQAAHPTWNPAAFQRKLRALVEGRWKYIWGSDGRHALYDLAEDPLEARNLLQARGAVGKRLDARLAATYASLDHCDPEALAEAPRLGDEQRGLLEALGYAEDQNE